MIKKSHEIQYNPIREFSMKQAKAMQQNDASAERRVSRKASYHVEGILL